MTIEKYTKEYEPLVDRFTCGNLIIDNFLQNGDALDENQGITYIMLSEKKDVIIGYYIFIIKFYKQKYPWGRTSRIFFFLTYL